MGYVVKEVGSRGIKVIRWFDSVDPKICINNDINIAIKNGMGFDNTVFLNTENKLTKKSNKVIPRCKHKNGTRLAR